MISAWATTAHGPKPSIATATPPTPPATLPSKVREASNLKLPLRRICATYTRAIRVKRIFTEATAVIQRSAVDGVYSTTASEIKAIDNRLTSTANQNTLLMCLSSTRCRRTSGSSSIDENRMPTTSTTAMISVPMPSSVGVSRCA